MVVSWGLEWPWRRNFQLDTLFPAQGTTLTFVMIAAKEWLGPEEPQRCRREKKAGKSQTTEKVWLMVDSTREFWAPFTKIHSRALYCKFFLLSTQLLGQTLIKHFCAPNTQWAKHGKKNPEACNVRLFPSRCKHQLNASTGPTGELSYQAPPHSRIFLSRARAKTLSIIFPLQMLNKILNKLLFKFTIFFLLCLPKSISRPVCLADRPRVFPPKTPMQNLYSQKGLSLAS